MKILRRLLNALHSSCHQSNARAERDRRLQFDQLEDRRLLAFVAADTVYDVAYQTDGKLVVFGHALDADSAAMVYRYNDDGSLDLTFGDAGRVNTDVFSRSFHGSSVAVDSAGRIVVAGTSNPEGDSGTDCTVIRLNGDGSFDSTFDDDGRRIIDFEGTDDGVRSMAVDSTDRIVVVVNRTIYPYTGAGFAVVRLNTDGSLDTAFSDDGKQTVDFDLGIEVVADVAVDSADRIVMVGTFESEVTGIPSFAIARLNSAGALDTTFSDDGRLIVRTGINGGYDSDAATSVAVDSANRIVVAGFSQQPNSGVFNGVDFVALRLNSDGTLDASFSGDGKQSVNFGDLSHESVWAMAVDSVDRIVLAGPVENEHYGTQQIAVTRLNSYGELDLTFGAGGTVFDLFSGFWGDLALAVDSADRILVGDIGPAPLVRLTASGALDPTFDPDFDGDFIARSIDTDPANFSNDFSDVGINGGATTGTIISRGDQILTITDAPNSADGVLISAATSGGATPATISIDGGAATLTLSAGDQVIATHGSVILHVLAGAVEATYKATSGQIVATASLSSGTELTFKPDTVTFIAGATTVTPPVVVTLLGAGGQQATATITDDSRLTFNVQAFTFTAPATNSAPVEVVVNGAPVTVVPGATVKPVQIDIKPGVAVNTLNLDSNGVLAVAILSSATFDARQIAVGTVVFAGAHAVQSAVQDVNGDGRLDLVLNFKTQQTNLRAVYSQLLADDINGDGVLDSSHQNASVALSGETVDHVLVEGFDSLDLFLAGKSLRTLLDQLAASGAI